MFKANTQATFFGNSNNCVTSSSQQTGRVAAASWAPPEAPPPLAQPPLPTSLQKLGSFFRPQLSGEASASQMGGLAVPTLPRAPLSTRALHPFPHHIQRAHRAGRVAPWTQRGKWMFHHSPCLLLTFLFPISLCCCLFGLQVACSLQPAPCSGPHLWATVSIGLSFKTFFWDCAPRLSLYLMRLLGHRVEMLWARSASDGIQSALPSLKWKHDWVDSFTCISVEEW